MEPTPTKLGDTVVQLADNLVADFDVVDFLTLVADRCVSLLDLTAAGLMLVAPDGTLRVIAASSEQMRLLELLELQTDEGPCLECFRTARTVTHTDLSERPDRWPQFAAAALDAGFRAVAAVPMRIRGQVIGALSLFRAEPGGAEPITIETAQALADIASIAVLQYRARTEANELVDQLNTALSTRIVIEQAKGVVAERLQVDMEQAFLVLRHHARTRNARLSAVAEAVVDGTLSTADLTATRPGANPI